MALRSVLSEVDDDDAVLRTAWGDPDLNGIWDLHFTPTSASWLNQVERWFAVLTERQIRRGTHRSTTELERAIEAYLAVCNEQPAPFIWTKTADQILASLKHYCTRPGRYTGRLIV